MKIIKITRFDVSNGPGIRDVIWVSGCEHQCYKCHNPQTWNKDLGISYEHFNFDNLKKDLANEHIRGVTFSGGDPLALFNRDSVIDLALKIRCNYPDKDIWCYTGYSWEDVRDIPGIGVFDVIVDGEYHDDERDITLPYCGSRNQRVINVVESLKTNSIALF